MELTGKDLIRRVMDTLTDNGFDYKLAICKLGQVQAAEKREKRESFSFDEHFKGLILSQLSNQRPWKQIADNASNLEKIFCSYSSRVLENANAIELDRIIQKIKEAKCGNRSLRAQIRFLRENIRMLRRIEEDYMSLDQFVESERPPIKVAEILAHGKYKLRQIGVALACEYLKNVGIKIGKPDQHIVRLLGAGRLALVETNPNEETVTKHLAQIAGECNESVVWVDNLLWLFCAKAYGAICGKKPQCEICHLRDACNQQVAD